MFYVQRGKVFSWLAICLGVLMIASGPAFSASSPWVKANHASARLITSVGETGDLATMPAGLEIKLDGDWKTYWRSPGDAGLPPTLNWKGSVNIASTALLYPAPERVTVLGIQTFGYKHDVVFPVDITLVERGKPLDLKLALEILVCAEQCVPEVFDLALMLPLGHPTVDADAQVLAKARAAVPGDTRTSGLRITSVEEVFDHGELALEVRASADRPFTTPDVIAEVRPEISLGTPRVVLSSDKHEARFDLPLSRKLPIGGKLAGRDLTLTLTDGVRALEQITTISRGASTSEDETAPSLIAMLGIALLGGLILNLMPCVLPVLSLKLISVVSQGGRAPAAVRAGFLATAAGVVSSFLVIASALIAVKAAGRSIGWGVQFQEPAFIAGMAVLVTVFACHLLGFFEVPLPRFIANAASKRSGPDESLAGHFATGAFATLLATPCSAPFLGTAVGFALAGGAVQILAIFTALGIGLALPYLLVAAMPRLATRMPKPGIWMVRVKQAMAIPLAGTAVWLIMILSAQIGSTPAFIIAGFLVLMAATLCWRDHLPERSRGLVFPFAVAVAIAAVVMPGVIVARVGTQAVDANDTIAWTSFDREKIRSLVSQGKTVFVDVTADWCLTCQANKKFVLSTDAVAKRLNSQAVSMKADWTRPNAAIGSYLAGYGRYGIPFNIVYGPGAPGGIVLPELLTIFLIEDALDKAAGSKASDLAPPRRKDLAAIETRSLKGFPQ